MHTHKLASLSGLIFGFAFIMSFIAESRAKSLYVGMHDPLAIRAYRISGDQLQYQTDAQGYSSGWTGMTLDPNSGMAFVTAESSNYIYLLDARTMIFEESTTETYGGAGVINFS